MSIVCNAKILNAPLTGVQRYLIEILSRAPKANEAGGIDLIKAPSWAHGPAGHLWEQTVVPAKSLGRTLFSPSNTGPLAIRRQVVTLHDIATIESPEGFSPAFRAYYAWILPRLLPRVEAVITVSEFTRQRAIERFKLNPENVHAIPLGVDHTRFNPRSKEEITAVRTKLNLPERYILFLGTLSARKNVARLIEAWAKAQTAVDADIELVIAGGGGATHVFNGTTLPTLPPRTRVMGRVEEADLPALLSGATLFTFPSTYEGFGLPPLEAMACGTPVYIGNATSLPEVVGEAAIKVNPFNVDDMTDGLIRVLTEPSLCKKLSLAGQKQAAQFQWNKTAEATLQLLKSV